MQLNVSCAQTCYQKQCQNFSIFLLFYTTLLFFFNAIRCHAQLQDYHYANENPNGLIRQFVDSSDSPSSSFNQTGFDALSDTLPGCSQIPKLLCCTSRVLQKCYDGCLEHVQIKCTHKLRQFERFQIKKASANQDVSQQNLSLESEENDTNVLQMSKHSLATTKEHTPVTLPTLLTSSINGQMLSRNQTQSIASTPMSSDFGLLSSTSDKSTNMDDVDLGLPSGGGFIEPLIIKISNMNNAVRLSDIKRGHSQKNMSSNTCGTSESKPAYLPCYSRQIVDSLFSKCCRESVPPECRLLCTYEHREEFAAKTLITAVQDKHCDLKWLSSILRCANQNRDNRACCRYLNLANADLGVGDRCLRMCTVNDEKSAQVDNVDQSDLVCLSNWNVIMYCARAGIHSLSRQN